MSLTEFASGFFSQVWRIFSVQSPFFGLTFGQIWLGFFVAGIAVVILSKAFSLGDSLMPHPVRTSAIIGRGKRYQMKANESRAVAHGKTRQVYDRRAGGYRLPDRR